MHGNLLAVADFFGVLRVGVMQTTAILVLLSLSASAHACWDSVAQKYAIHPALLRAIAEQESGFNNRAVNSNANGSRDVCMMQVNSSWFPVLKHRFNISERDLKSNWCTCLDVGAWILAQGCAHAMTWDCVGAYNATSHVKRSRYAWQIFHRLYPAQVMTGAKQTRAKHNSVGHVAQSADAEAAQFQSIMAYEQ
jgi:soluble lytic murein transglycosylase-like protein